jgi:hypothetical protein
MLAAVKAAFENGYGLDDKDFLISSFLKYKDVFEDVFESVRIDDLKNPQKITEKITKIIQNTVIKA